VTTRPSNGMVAAATTRRGQVAYALAAACVAVTLVAAGLALAHGDSLVGGFGLALLVVGTVYATVGGLLWARVPGNPIGPIFLAAAWSFGLTFLLDEYASIGAASSGGLPAVGLAAWLGRWLWIPGNALMLCALPLVFPDGHLPSPRWRPAALFVAVGVAFAVATSAIASLPLIADPADATVTDPTAVPGVVGWLAAIGQITLFIVAPIVSLSAVIFRYRRSRGVVRQQMRWFTLALVLLVTTIIGDELASQVLPAAQGLVGVIGLTVLPLALGIAVLRYRLFDIDRIISRTISYAVITVALVTTFAGAILLFQALLAPLTGQDTIAVAASTLVVAALFQPLRIRVRRVIDRRFYRARYDAERTAAAFAARLRDQTDLAAIHADVLAAVDESLRPARLDLWVRDA
jgi:hypothetical protein